MRYNAFFVKKYFKKYYKINKKIKHMNDKQIYMYYILLL